MPPHYLLCQYKNSLIKHVQQIGNAIDRSRLIDKSAGNVWDLSIPGELFWLLSICSY
jgi:hypothetical protein